MGQEAQQISKKLNFDAVIPDSPSIQLPSDTDNSANEKIKKANASAKEMYNKTKMAAIRAFLDAEKAKAKQQGPLLGIVKWIVGGQLLVFNLIIAIISIVCLCKFEETALPELLGFLKYYVGAVVVELIGLLVFITKSIYSSGLKDVVDKFFNDNERELE